MTNSDSSRWLYGYPSFAVPTEANPSFKWRRLRTGSTSLYFSSSQLTDEKREEEQYCCRECKTSLFQSRHIVEHTHEDEILSLIHDACPSSIIPSGPCDHYFVRLLCWMDADVNTKQMRGRLHCPECKNELGAWTWYDSCCKCGGSSLPSFMVSISSVETAAKTTDPALLEAKD